MNPYGVDLEMFPTAQRRQSRQGVHSALCRIMDAAKGLRFAGVRHSADSGSAARSCRINGRRSSFSDERIRALSISIPCRRRELARFYAEADAFVLASREDGFGVVLAQALASGLPVICTDRTGGADLAHTPALAQRITIIPHDDLCALVAAVAGLRDRHKAGERLPPLADADRETLSWKAYGRRYAEQIAADFGQCSRA